MSFGTFLNDTVNFRPNPRVQAMIGDMVSSAVKSAPRVQPNLEHISSGRWVIPPEETYSARYSSGINTYYQYFDEAIRNSTANALAMRRDPAIGEPLDHRKMATVSQDWYLKPDDPNDPDQKRVCDELESVLENTSMIDQFLLNLLEDIFFGKAGCQSQFQTEMVKGKKRLVITDHAPVMGDKIQYNYSGTPGILVRGGSPYLNMPEYAKHIDRATLGPALFLNEPWLRDQFTISKFRTSDFDYIWEGDKALAVHGIGVRDSLYWAWNIRTEIFTWQMDALQRIGANGMTIGFFEYGNAESEAHMMKVMQQLVKDNYAVVGVTKNTDPQNMVYNIPVSAVGYEIMQNMVKYMDDFIRRAILGQELTSIARSSGMGAATANVQKSAFDHIVGFDSKRLGETISRQPLKVLLKYNTWTYRKQELTGDQLPFSIKLIFEDRDDEDESPADTAKTLHEIGLPLDKEDILDKTDFSAPKDPQSTLPGKQDQPSANGSATPQATQRKGIASNGRKVFGGFGERGSTPEPTKNGHPIDQMEMFVGPVDEKRDDSGKWTSGGGSTTTKEKEIPETRNSDQPSLQQSKAEIWNKNPNGVKGNLRSIFGRGLSDEAVSSLSGAPDDSEVTISDSKTDSGEKRVNMIWTTPYSEASRTILKENGEIILHNNSFIVDEEYQGKGIGSKVFGMQVSSAVRLGVDKIKTNAARFDRGGWFGYKVWPMFGYDGDIPMNVGKGPNGEKRVSELMRTKEGRDWWAKNGNSIDLEFDLAPGSYSMKTWEAYQSRKKS